MMSACISKTAGTTWLKEVAGLAESGGKGLDLAKEILITALPHAADLIKPYAPVLAIATASLPTAGEVAAWISTEFVELLEHNPACPLYDPQLHQFIHVSFPVAAEMGSHFTNALKANAAIINRSVPLQSSQKIHPAVVSEVLNRLPLCHRTLLHPARAG
jgi:hypothetical protein